MPPPPRRPPPSGKFSRPGWLAISTVLAYAGVAVVAATILFARRDVVTA